MPEIDVWRRGRKAARPKRRVISVRWDPLGWWYATDKDRFHERRKRKTDVVQVARTVATAHHANGGLAQIRVFGKNGRIQREFTYGRDPRRRHG